MAKMFYTLEEAGKILQCDSSGLKQLCMSEKLREFRDGPRLMFKADQIDSLAESRRRNAERVTISLKDLGYEDRYDGLDGSAQTHIVDALSDEDELAEDADDPTLGEALIGEITTGSRRVAPRRMPEMNEPADMVLLPRGARDCEGAFLSGVDMYVLVPVLSRSRELF